MYLAASLCRTDRRPAYVYGQIEGRRRQYRCDAAAVCVDDQCAGADAAERPEGDGKPLAGQVSLSWMPGLCAHGYSVSRWNGSRWVTLVSGVMSEATTIKMPTASYWSPIQFGVSCTPS